MPTYRTGNNTYAVVKQTGYPTGGAANTASATFGENRTSRWSWAQDWSKYDSRIQEAGLDQYVEVPSISAAVTMHQPTVAFPAQTIDVPIIKGPATSLSYLEQINTAVDSSTYSFPSVTVEEGVDYYLVTVASAAATAPSVNSITGVGGMTWTERAGAGGATYGGGSRRLQFFHAEGINASGTVDVGLDGVSTSFHAVILRVVSTNHNNPIVQSKSASATAATSISTTLNDPVANIANRSFAIFAHDADEATTPRANWTELRDHSSLGPAIGFESQWRVEVFESTASASWATASDAGMIAFELDARGRAVTIYLPSLTQVSFVAPNLITAAVTVHNPTAVPGTVTVGMNALTVSPVLHQPTVLQFVEANLITATATVRNPGVFHDQQVVVPVIGGGGAPLSITQLTTGNDSAAASVYTTASVSPAANSMLVVVAVSTDTVDPGSASISTGLSGVTWTDRKNHPWDTSSVITSRMRIWTGICGASPGSGTITFTLPDNATGTIWVVYQITGYNTTTPVVQVPTNVGDTLAFTASLDFAAAADSVNNAFLAFFTKNGVEALTAEAGWTEGTEALMANPNTRLKAQWRTADDTNSTMTWTTQNRRWASAGLELAAGVVSNVTVHNPTVFPVQTVEPQLISSAVTVHNPAPVVEAQVVAMNALSVSSTKHQPTVLPGAVTVVMNALTITSTKHNPTVVPTAEWFFEELLEGPIGNDLTTGNTAFDEVSGFSAESGIAFIPTAFQGNTAAELSAGPTNSSIPLVGKNIPAIRTLYGRFLFRFHDDGVKDMNTTIIRGRANGANAWRILGKADQHITIRNAANTVTATSTVAIPDDQWVRIEWKYEAGDGSTNGQVTVRIYLNPNTDTIDDTLVGTAGNYGPHTDNLRVGMAAVEQNKYYVFDALRMRTDDWVGPILWVKPNRIISTVTVRNPAVNPVVAMNHIPVAVTLHQPGIFIRPDLITAPVTMHLFEVVYQVQMNHIALTHVVYAPTVVWIVQPGPAINNGYTVHNPVVAPGPAIPVVMNALNVTSTKHNPSINPVVAPQLITAAAVAHQPTVVQLVAAQHIPVAVTVHAPSILQVVQPPVIGSTVTVHQPTVATGLVLVDAQLITVASTVHSPAVLQIVQAQLITAAVSVFSPTVLQAVAMLTTTGAVSVHNPTISVANQVVMLSIGASTMYANPTGSASANLTGNPTNGAGTRYQNIDDGTTYASSDDDSSYVRPTADEVEGTITLSFTGLPDFVRSLTVFWRAKPAGASQAQADTWLSIYDLNSLIVDTPVKHMVTNNYVNLEQYIGGLAIPGANLRVVLHLQGSGVGNNCRATNLWIEPNMVSVHSPAVSPGVVTVEPNQIAVTANVRNPAVAKVVTPDLITAVATVHNPTVPILMQQILQGYTAHAPDIVRVAGMQLLSVPATAHNPTVATGVIFVEMEIIHVDCCVIGPKVNPGPRTIVAQRIVVTSTLHNPAVSALVEPALVSVSASVLQPAVAQFVSIQALAVAATVRNPVVSIGGIAVTPEALTITSVVHNPDITVGAVVVSMQLITAAVTVHNPQMTAIAYVDAESVIAGVVVHAADIVQVVSMTLTTSTVTVHAPTTFLSIALDVQLISVAATVRNPTVIAGVATVAMNALSVASTVRDPDVLAGVITVVAQRIIQGYTVHNPATLPGGVDVSMESITIASIVRNPVVIPGAVSVVLVAMTVPQTVHGPAVVQIVQPSSLTVPTIARAPAVVVGTVTIFPDRIAVQVTVWAPRILGGIVRITKTAQFSMTITKSAGYNPIVYGMAQWANTIYKQAQSNDTIEKTAQYDETISP